MQTYYRKFVKDFSDVASPLHRLTQKNKPWEWTTECQQAFVCLKECLISAPVLAFPSFDLPFVLDTDASNAGLGGVLSQNVHGTECVIAYASRVLTKSERSYCATKKELLALVWAVQHFRPYLIGKPFIVHTDHNSLKWLQNFKDAEGQVARWLEILAEYQMCVEHHPGKSIGGCRPGLSPGCKLKLSHFVVTIIYD